jgi:hypothetical protein
MNTLPKHVPQEWTTGLSEIRDIAQTAMTGGTLLDTKDVTPQVLKLADQVWGPHDVSPDMTIVAHGAIGTSPAPYLYAKDRVVRDTHGRAQGGYLDPRTGLFVVQEPGVFYNWVDDRALPSESPFSIARIVITEQFGVDALKSMVEGIRSRRATDQIYWERSEAERVKNAEEVADLREFTISDPFLSRLTEGIADDQREVFADQLRKSKAKGKMTIWDNQRLGDSTSPPDFEEARSIIEGLEGKNGSGDYMLVDCPGPGAICELIDVTSVRGRQYLDFSNTNADHAINRWMSSQSGNHGVRTVTPIGHEFTAEEQKLVKMEFGLRSAFYGSMPEASMKWNGPLKPGYMVRISRDVKSAFDEHVYSQYVGTVYVPS